MKTKQCNIRTHSCHRQNDRPIEPKWELSMNLATAPRHAHAGRYILHDYDSRSPVSNFLPGVAGLYGKPVWSFYVNRGQGIASFGMPMSI